MIFSENIFSRTGRVIEILLELKTVADDDPSESSKTKTSEGRFNLAAEESLKR